MSVAYVVGFTKNRHTTVNGTRTDFQFNDLVSCIGEMYLKNLNCFLMFYLTDKVSYLLR